MHRDFKELLSAFNEGHVKYLVVGGYAVSMHAEPRAAKDLDILVGADSENATGKEPESTDERTDYRNWSHQ